MWNFDKKLLVLKAAVFLKYNTVTVQVVWGFKQVILQRLLISERPKVSGEPGFQIPWIGCCTLYLATGWLWHCPFLRWITNFIGLPTGLVSVKPMTARQKSNWTWDQIRATCAKGPASPLMKACPPTGGLFLFLTFVCCCYKPGQKWWNF